MLVFELPRKETVAPLRLYYGNPYIKMPDYDIQNTYDKNSKQIPLTIGIHTVNGKFSYSMIEPPVSTWIIRILFIVGFLSLVWLSYRIMRRYTEDMETKRHSQN